MEKKINKTPLTLLKEEIIDSLDVFCLYLKGKYNLRFITSKTLLDLVAIDILSKLKSKNINDFVQLNEQKFNKMSKRKRKKLEQIIKNSQLFEWKSDNRRKRFNLKSLLRRKSNEM